ncbi:hypothetical protein HID58_011885 [Brassica napus]|uniref:CASP-like protein n=1 Tax=Brassica napus TaxID=3708 RepID=A0ABQ8DZI1_BRANA|nr:hypothetical protein HID58_050158 [Brassica napus]KAH0934768.1 hypothetical protein HID58_011885 [Brassica napus]
MNSAKSNGKVGCLEQDLNQDRLISWSQHNQTDKEGRRLIIQACAIASGAVVFSESSLSTWEDKDSSLGMRRGYQANEVGEEGESGLRQHRSRLFSSLSLSSKVVVLLTMAYVFLRVYSEGSSGRVYQCGIPERPLDC